MATWEASRQGRGAADLPERGSAPRLVRLWSVESRLLDVTNGILERSPHLNRGSGSLVTVRAATAMIVVASILVGCGGGDGGSKARSASPAVVRSGDGRATLSVPPGVDTREISVRRVAAEGAVVAYELLPSGTKFDEPATLTITGVPAPEGNQPAFAILESEDGEADMVNGVATTYADGKDGVTVALPIRHFSVVTLNFLISATRGVLWDDWQGTAKLDTHVADMGSPLETGVGVPFDVSVRIARLDTRVDVEIPMAQDQSITVERVRANGAVTATNATPSRIRNLPRYGELGESYRGTGVFRCTRPGLVDLNYTVDFTFDLDWDRTLTVGSRSFTRDASVSIERFVKCIVPTTTTTSSTAGAIIGSDAVETTIYFTNGSCTPRSFSQQFRITPTDLPDGRVQVELRQMDTGQVTTGVLAPDGKSVQLTGENSAHLEKYDLRRGAGNQIEGEYTATGKNGPCTWKITAEAPATR